MEKKMKKNTIINFEGKKIKIPFDVYVDPKKATELETVTNPLSGQKAILPAFAVAVLDVIKGSEVLLSGNPGPLAAEIERSFNKGREFFQKYFTEEYYTLLD
tara:strand:- start:122 stop:427 length:306 start_codon:yes stop_codon:yes gene_type:complete